MFEVTYTAIGPAEVEVKGRAAAYLTRPEAEEGLKRFERLDPDEPYSTWPDLNFELAKLKYNGYSLSFEIREIDADPPTSPPDVSF